MAKIVIDVNILIKAVGAFVRTYDYDTAMETIKFLPEWRRPKQLEKIIRGKLHDFSFRDAKETVKLLPKPQRRKRFEKILIEEIRYLIRDGFIHDAKELVKHLSKPQKTEWKNRIANEIA